MPESETPIPLGDLHIIRAALNSAFHQNTVLDLAEQYRKLTQRSTQSKLTVAIENALLMVQEYIDTAQTKETPDEQQPE